MRLFNWYRRHFLLSLACAAGFVIWGILTLITQNIVRTQYSQSEAERWAADGLRYAQVSAFLSTENALTVEDISGIRSKLANSLKEASFTSETTKGRLWIDAYSAFSNVDLQKQTEMGSASVSGVEAVGIGGDFFQFHPFHLLSGSYLSKDDNSIERVLVDEEIAWQLYGSNDIAGQSIFIADKQFIVAGVVRPDSGKYAKIAQGDSLRIYMPFEALKAIDSNLMITGYEVVMPSPVSGFALSKLKSAFGESEDSSEEEKESTNTGSSSGIVFIDNSARFSNWTLLSKLWKLPTLMMRTDRVSYPYWENTVQATELELAWLVLFKTFFLVVPILVIAIKVILWIRKQYPEFKRFIRKKISDIIENMNAKSRKRREKKEIET